MSIYADVYRRLLRGLLDKPTALPREASPPCGGAPVHTRNDQVVAGALILAAVNAWWYTSHRRGLPLFIDESGYPRTRSTTSTGWNTTECAGWSRVSRTTRSTRRSFRY